MSAVDVKKIAIRAQPKRKPDPSPSPRGAVRREPNGTSRATVAVSRRSDILDTERAHDRISEAAYQAGIRIQEVIERGSSLGGSFWADGGKVDASSCHEARIGHSVENARRIRALADNVAGIVGMIDMRLLRRVIGERMGFEACAALEGKSGDRGSRYVAARFRDALEEVAKAWASKGLPLPVVDDKHARRAVEVQRSRLDRSGEI